MLARNRSLRLSRGEVAGRERRHARRARIASATAIRGDERPSRRSRPCRLREPMPSASAENPRPASPRPASSMPAIVPARITAMRSLMPSTSGSSDEIMTIARPRSARSCISPWISAFAPTSTPCVGSSRIRTIGLGRQPARQRDLLLVAARQRTDVRGHRRRLDPELLDVALGQRRFAARSISPRRETAARLARLALAATDISSTTPCWRRSSGTYAMPSAIACRGDVDAAPLCRARESRRNRPASDRTGSPPAACGPIRRAPRGRESRRAAPTTRRRGRRSRGATRRRRSSATSPSATARLGKTAESSRPTISRMSSARSTPSRQQRRDRLAVAQHGDAIGDREHLLETMRDVDDADAVRRGAADDVEQPLDLALGKRRRRLVHDRRSCASAPIALAISTSCCSGMLSDSTSRPGSMRRADARSASRAARCARAVQSSCARAPPLSSASAMFSATVRCGKERRLLVDRRDAERAR